MLDIICDGFILAGFINPPSSSQKIVEVVKITLDGAVLYKIPFELLENGTTSEEEFSLECAQRFGYGFSPV